ncbi:hypothetical protein JTB14_027209 [Gonioctena quinquepunctata]|nr:hypothetical protein JTB14_027209 [Gonioctena quinquepunctata]
MDIQELLILWKADDGTITNFLDVKLIKQILFLPQLIPPKGRVKLSTKTWKFTAVECQEGFLVHVTLKRGGDFITAELNDVSKVINYVNPHINTDVIRPMRLGKYDANRTIPRPIKVTLENEATVLACTRNTKNLKNDNFKNVFISFDKTPRQMQYYRDLRQELDEKKNNGENNLTIKYSNGDPKIVNLN